MPEITSELDFSGLRENLIRSKVALRRDIAQSVRAAGDEAVRVAKAGSFKDRTGNLRNTIFVNVIGWLSDTFCVKVQAPAEYAHFVDQPTQAHDIWPKAVHGLIGPVRSGQSRRAEGPGQHQHIVGLGRFLRWKDDSGQQHFARMVRHPGTTGTRFFASAIDAAQLKLITELSKGFTNVRSVWA